MLNEEALSQVSGKIAAIQAARAPGRGATIADIAFSLAEVGVGVAAAGYVNGRFASPGKDHLTIAGVPADLSVGLIGVVAACLGTFGPLDSHVAKVSIGAIGMYLGRVTGVFGADAKIKAKEAAEQAESQAKQMTAGKAGGGNKVVKMRQPVAEEVDA